MASLEEMLEDDEMDPKAIASLAEMLEDEDSDMEEGLEDIEAAIEEELDILGMRRQMAQMQKLLEKQGKELEAMRETVTAPPSPRREASRSLDPSPRSSTLGTPPRRATPTNKPMPSRVLHVRNTPRDVTVREIKGLFKGCLQVVSPSRLPDD